MINIKPNVCSFFGHRNTQISKELKQKLREVIEDLILNHNVSIFLFGSNSKFNYLCHLIVTELKEKYSKIKRIAYTCKNENCILEKERKKWEELYSRFEAQEVELLGFEEEFEHKTKFISGRASYVERNQAMINNSNYCIFYYDENYQPEVRKYSQRDVFYYQPKSGTAIAYKYAKQKKKVLINIVNLNI